MDDNNIFFWVKAIVTAGVGAFGAAFGWLGWLVLAWVVCMAIDWISGSAAAAAKGEWSSATARAGIWHKAVVQAACIKGYLFTGLTLPSGTLRKIPMSLLLIRRCGTRFRKSIKPFPAQQKKVTESTRICPNGRIHMALSSGVPIVAVS